MPGTRELNSSNGYISGHMAKSQERFWAAAEEFFGILARPLVRG